MGRRAALAGAFSLACAREPVQAPAPRPPPARYSGRLEDYVPAAGLRWLLSGSPAKLAESQSFRPALQLIFAAERLRAVAQITGFALESLPRAVIAGFDLGTLYLAELPDASAARAREHFASRQIQAPTPRSVDPAIILLSGVREGVPVALLTIDERVVIYGVGDATLWRVAEAYALGRLHAKRAFEGAALAGQAGESDGALLAAHVPGPFDEHWEQAAAGLLAITTSLSSRLDPGGPERATWQVVLHGDFADSNAIERLRSTYMSVASSSTGTLLGLGTALDARVSLNSESDRLALSVSLPITEVAKGARAATSADLEEVLRLSPKSESPLPPTSPPDRR
jgi:hypothetical protein